MAYLLPARAFLLLRAPLFTGFLEDFFARVLLPARVFSAPPCLRGEPALFPSMKAARTHTTGGKPSRIACHDLPSSFEP
jgi:hypothetical protein